MGQLMIADETLVQRRARLEKRLAQIEGEKHYRVWRGGEKEPAKLVHAIAKIERKQKRGAA